MFASIIGYDNYGISKIGYRIETPWYNYPNKSLKSQ